MAHPSANAVFEILAREHSDRLMAFLRAVSLDQATADDLFQETMLRAWRRLDSYDRSRPFGMWLRGIARLVAMENYRARRRAVVSSELIESVQAQADRFDGPSGVEFHEQLAALNDCVDKLAEPYATTMDMAYHLGESADRIAEQLRERVETIKKRVQRGRMLVSECLQRKGLLA